MNNADLALHPIRDSLNIIVKQIVDGYQPEKIILFGSYAYGQPHPDSDLDILIVKQTDKRPIDRRIDVRMLLRSLKIKLSVSPIVVTKDEIEKRLAMGDPFAEEIIKRGLVLYEQG
jgi:predicted nucleotidyltransferase